MIVTEATLHKVEAAIRDSDRVTVDLETTGLNPWGGDRLCGVAIRAGGVDFYLPFRHTGTSNLPMDILRGPVAAWLTHPTKTYVGYNYKFDLGFLAVDGVDPPEHILDPMLGMHLLNENEPSFALKKLAEKYLGSGSADEEKKLNDQLALWGYGKADMWRMPPEVVAPYAEKDVELTERFVDWLTPRLEAEDLLGLWTEVSEYTLVLARMERLGILVDEALCRDRMAEADRESLKVLQKIRDAAGFPLNPGSPKQLQRWLGLPSTARDVLEPLEAEHPEVRMILSYRAWQKAAGTYYRPFLAGRDEDGAIHVNLKAHGTVTGRLASSKPGPPLLAIPRYRPEYKVKDVLRARDGYLLVEMDYSQAEVRVASHYAQERTMGRLLLEGADIHTETAESVGIPRDAAKRLNFSVIYGIGADALSHNLKISKAKAASYLYKYHAHYPGFRLLYKRAESVARNRGYIRLHTGRRRHYNCDTAPPHKASSNLVQGSVTEMLREAAMRIWRGFDRSQVRMLLKVHDSIIFEVSEEEADRVIPALRSEMETNPWCTIPVPVDVKTGRTWGTTKERDR